MPHRLGADTYDAQYLDRIAQLERERDDARDAFERVVEELGQLRRAFSKLKRSVAGMGTRLLELAEGGRSDSPLQY